MMISKMVPRLVFSITHLVFMLIQFESTTQARVRWVDTLPTLTAPKFVKSVVVDRINSGDVFVGGINVLYHLSADLELKQNVSIGPVDDYPGCPAPPYPCGKLRVPTDNVARIVQLVYDLAQSPCLLLCGSVYRNLCQVRPLDNLTEYHWVHPYNESLGYTTNPQWNYVIINRGFDGQTSLFTATHNSAGLSPFTAPFLSTKVLKNDGDRYYFQHAFQNDTFLNAVTFKKNGKIRITIDGGFLHDDYIYFPTILFNGNYSITRLVRFCSRDPTFRSYQELTLQCNHMGLIVKRLMAAHLGPSRLYGSTKKSLYLCFSDGGTGSALCSHEMSSVVAAFETWPRVCNRDVAGERCDDEPERIVDFCGSYPMYYDGRPFVVNRTLEISMITGDLLEVKDMLGRNTPGTFENPFVFDREEKHIYLLTRNKVIKFPVESCGMYETCDDCFVRGRKQDPLKCGWCVGRCARSEECADSFSADTCTPTIYEVFPEKGPIQGGNTITISGDSFGSYVNDALTSISVAGIPCMSPSWRSDQINCTLGSTTEELSGPVEVKVINALSNGYKIEGSSISETNFSYYLGFRLYGIQPSKGPTSGGTLVKLYGEDLGRDLKDKKCMASVYGRPCILQSFDQNSVSCIIQNSTDSRFSNTTIAIHVDGVAYLMEENPPSTFNLTGISQTFEFTRDPYINRIQPGITTLSGLVNLTAFGRYLDSVQFPKLVVKVDETQIMGESEMVEDCWTDPKSKGTWMTCRTPSLKDAAIFPLATRTHPFIVQVSFLMDGVQKLRDLPKHREDLSRLLYYPDPEFQVFQELEKVKKDKKMFEIKGKYLDLVHLADNLQVRIGGNDTCKIASVSSDNLFCELPRSLSMSSSKTNMSIEVYVGTEIYHLGYIDIEENDEGISIWVLLLVPAVIAICMLLMFLYCRKVHGKKPFCISEMNLRTAIPHDYREVPTQAEAATSPGCLASRNVPTQAEATTSPGGLASRAESRGVEVPLVDNETKGLFASKGRIILKDDLEITEREIGKGQFGCVYEGYHQLPNMEKIKVAVKTLRETTDSRGEPEAVNIFLEEARIMLEFDDPNVLRLYGVCFDGSGPAIVLPFMENGDLLSFIQSDRHLTKSDLMKFAVDISAGMAYLEENRFVHRDLAARNNLIDRDWNVKVADFGLSRDIYINGEYVVHDRKKAMLPYRWSALESLEQSMYTTKSDVWCYGVVVWELMTRGGEPYTEPYVHDLVKFLKQGGRLPRPYFCPIPLYYIMQACWNTNPEERPTFLKLNELIRELVSLLQENVPNETMPTPETVPAKHTVYHNSEELYLCMEGRHLDRELLKDLITNNEQ